MATGVLIRDFHKEYRELRYTNSGSIRLSEIEHNAYRNALTIEVSHIDAPRYANLKTLPSNSHYGYCTTFKGSTVTNSISIKYAKFRVFDILNQGVWNYHQLSENQQLGASTIQLSVNAAARSLWEVLGDGIGNLTEFLIGLYYFSEGADVPRWVLQAFDEVPGPEEPFGNEFEKYRAFPIASPFPDVIKFKSDLPASFLFRLESWYLVNPITYIVDNPTDTSDETDGEDEYPSPEAGDGDGDGDEFPIPDLPGPGTDPRDFGGELTPSGEGTFSVYWCTRNRLGVQAGVPPNCTSASAYVGYPGSIQELTQPDGSARVVYAWSGGTFLLTSTNYPPVEVTGFRIEDGGNVVFSL